MVLLVLKVTDYRMSIEQICSAYAIIKFLEHLEPENTFIVFTHCEEDNAAIKPDSKYIKDKLASFKKYTKLNIPIDNVVLFDKTSLSLEEFIDNMVEGNMNIAHDIEELAE